MAHIQDVGSLFALIAQAVSDINQMAGFAPGDQIYHLSTGYVISGAGNEDCNGEVSYRKMGFETRGNYQDVTIETDATGLKIIGGDDPRWAIEVEEGVAYLSNTDTDDPAEAVWEVETFGSLPLPTVTAVERIYPSTVTQLMEKIFADSTFTGTTVIANLRPGMIHGGGGGGIYSGGGSNPLFQHNLATNPINNFGGFKVDADHLIYEAVVGGVAKTIDLGALS